MKRFQAMSLGVAVVLLGLAGPAVAGEPQQQGESMPPNQSQQSISDNQLRQFADAMSEVRSVQQEYAEAIQEAEDMEQAQTLREDAQVEMRGAVEDTGLTIAEYNLIAQRLQSDQDLVRRLQSIDNP